MEKKGRERERGKRCRKKKKKDFVREEGVEKSGRGTRGGLVR